MRSSFDYGNDLLPSLPVGASMVHNQYLGELLTLDDGSEWLKQGTQISYSGKYAKAGKIDHIRGHGIAQAAITATGSLGPRSATDGVGNVVLVSGIAGNTIQQSADGGKTWTTRTVGGTGTAFCDVVWAGDRFIVVASTSTNAYFAHSTNGQTWTVGTTLTYLTSGAASIARLGYNPTTGTVLAAIGTTTASAQVARCVSGGGSTFTTTASATTLSASTSSSYAWACNGSRWVLLNDAGTSSSTYGYYNDADGVGVWSGGSLLGTVANGTPVSCAYLNGTFIATSAGGNSNIFTSIDGAAWTARGTPFMAAVSAPAIVSDGKRFMCAEPYGGMKYSTDGLIWRRRNFPAGASIGGVLNTGTTFLLLPAATYTIPYVSASFDATDWVGTNFTASMFDVNNTPGPGTNYYRIR